LATEVHDNARNRIKRNLRVDGATPQSYSSAAPAELGESPGQINSIGAADAMRLCAVN
jgi:hypothetical protein